MTNPKIINNVKGVPVQTEATSARDTKLKNLTLRALARAESDRPIDAQPADDVRRIIEAVEARTAADVAVRNAVMAARANNKSWNVIAVALGVSRQAARQKYAEATADG
jgi:hypothetical protein